MYEDLKKFIEIKLNWAKKDTNKSMKDRKTVLNTGLEALQSVDVSRNFNLRDCFSSKPIGVILENYIYNMVVPTLQKFFELRIKMNEKHNNLVRNTIRLIAEASKYSSRNNSYVRNINNIYKTFWKIP